MPQQWRLEIYRRSCAGATPEQMQREFGLPAEEIALRVEAARLCFEKQCLVAGVEMGAEVEGVATRRSPEMHSEQVSERGHSGTQSRKRRVRTELAPPNARKTSYRSGSKGVARTLKSTAQAWRRYRRPRSPL
jgi:hypothetical protein